MLFIDVEKSLQTMCSVQHNEGKWIDHTAALSDDNLSQTTSHVAVLMDDVDIQGIDVVSFLNTMNQGMILQVEVLTIGITSAYTRGRFVGLIGPTTLMFYSPCLLRRRGFAGRINSICKSIPTDEGI